MAKKSKGGEIDDGEKGGRQGRTVVMEDDVERW
jgi:hypothetical protein